MASVEAPPAPPPPVPVVVARADKADLPIRLFGLGTVTPITTVSVKTQVSGRVVKVAFDEGQSVKEGDLLIEIDPRPYRYALEQAEGQLMRDQALLKNAQLDLERYSRLGKENFISKQQRDTQDSLVHQYLGAVKVDEAQVQNARLNLEYCSIRAPISGRIGLRLVDLGNYVQPSDSNGLVVLTQLQPITVVFPIAEDHLPKVTPQLTEGRRLSASAFDRSGTRLLAEGDLSAIDNQVDPTTGTVKFKATFDNRDLSLFPNQFVKVRLLVSTIRDAVVVPAAAVQYGPKGPFAFVVSSESTAKATRLELGPADGDNVSVTSGLTAGDLAVVAGADRLRDGVKVRAEAK
nr:MdtA/MuxA family multidrug efflux RND transporter periplasmic adaptor subunit [Methylosinus sp. Sm6]